MVILEYNGARINSINVNNQPVSLNFFNGYYIFIPCFYLNDDNIVKINFFNTYSNEGNGLHRFFGTIFNLYFKNLFLKIK